ncbi:MAG: bifunctional phosphoribosylaminoimidazolecarboxamide formyltransferase/IMP cyclohydrolase [Candidatus Omnitrophica bacterium]|nr:bifunctional phosphoribosylaminoimidazolecarboxamide formyltransferase/IMP cyclohydrolase [Candidatus Omnitrophota bacterium]
MKRIQRALISVSDKTGLIPFARGLRRFGVQIVSTGGTAKFLKENGVPVTEISEFTGFPEILAGRVKTLHPKVHGGILARRQDREHLSQAKRLGLKLIDLVVVNLYPFEETACRKGTRLPDLIEQIDIGGVALIRSAAKNFESVGIVTQPSQYPKVLQSLEALRGGLSPSLRLQLAVEAFAESAYYDSVINQVLSRRLPLREKFPGRLVLGASRRQLLRYGENPHQSGAWYEWSKALSAAGGLGRARQLHGKELSFNNLLDLDAALQLVRAFKRPTAVLVKHNNPCGAASGGRVSIAFRRAFACDPLSGFGGVVGLNRPADLAAAKAILAAGFLECLVAPRYAPQALKLLRSKKNLRIIQAPLPAALPKGFFQMKQVGGGLLVQDPDEIKKSFPRWKAATRIRPTAAQRRDLLFAWTLSKFVRSNAIVLVKGEQAVGIGAGQMSRVDSVRAALKKAGKRARGAVLASDGFFPKPDGPGLAVRAGVRAIVQPGGSVQDPAVIRVAQRARIPMLLTGERHFCH